MSDTTTPTAPRPKRIKPKSRPQRWADAASRAASAIAAIRENTDELEAACSELREVQEEYEEWRDGLPENLRNSPCGEKLEEVCNIEIDGMADTVVQAVDDVESQISEAEGVDLPRGFGKD